MSQSLQYLSYCKRRLSVLLPLDTEYCFFNPICFKADKIYQVTINIEKIIKVFNGKIWEATEDEDLIYLIISRLVKKEVQKEIQFKEAV